MSKTSPLVLLISSAILGCASGNRAPMPTTPTPESLPGGTPSLPETTKNSGTTWKLSPSTTVDSYASTIKTSVHQEESQRTDRLTTITTYSLGLTRLTNEVAFSGDIIGFEVQGDNIQQSQIFSASVFPLSFEGRISNHNVSIKKAAQVESQILCADSLLTAFSSAEKNVVVPPLELAAGQTWQDSTSMTVCSGSLPIVVSTIRNYRVGNQASFGGQTALLLERTEKILTSGQGSQGQHQVVVAGNGTGTGQVYIDPTSGSLLGIRAKNETRISIKSSGQVHHFLQMSEEITDRRNLP